MALIGLFSVIIGQTLVEILKKFLNRAKEQADAQLGMRDELRLEIQRREKELSELRIEAQQLEASRDNWRIDYFRIYEAFYELRTIVIGLMHRHNESTIGVPEIPKRGGMDNGESKQS